MSQLNSRRFYSILKLISIGGLVAIAIVAVKYSNIQEILYHSLTEIKSLGWLAPIGFIFIYNLATLLFIPGSILTLKGGCLFGLFWGSIYVLIAATLGATFAFLLGRYLSRSWVERQMANHPKFRAIDKAVKQEGWKIVLLTRLCPLFPFNLLNYAFGVTQVSLKDYVLGSFGMIPATVMYVYIGAIATDLTTLNLSNSPTTKETQIAQWVIRGIGLIATIAVTVYITHIAKKTLDKSVVNETIPHAETENN